MVLLYAVTKRELMIPFSYRYRKILLCATFAQCLRHVFSGRDITISRKTPAFPYGGGLLQECIYHLENLPEGKVESQIKQIHFAHMRMPLAATT